MTADAEIFTEVNPSVTEALGDLLEALDASGAAAEFHPHPLTRQEAQHLASKQDRDGHFVLLRGGRALAYGLLRGWEAGYPVPSLGIAVHPQARGQGLARRMMILLHQEAQRRGARRVRLRVYPTNAAALRLYRSLGYRFAPTADPSGQLVGHLEL